MNSDYLKILFIEEDETDFLDTVMALANEASARGEPFRAPLDALPRKVRNLLPRTHQHYVRIVLRDMRAAGFAPDEARAVPTRRPL